MSSSSSSIQHYKQKTCIIEVISDTTPALSSPYTILAYNLGQSLALNGNSLMTGGSSTGLEYHVCRGFSSIPIQQRKGKSIAIIWSGIQSYNIPGITNEFVEIKSYLNLADYKVGTHKITSRNHSNEADVVIALPGNSHTRSQIEISVAYEHPVIVHGFWKDTFSNKGLWDFESVDDCLAFVNAVVRDKSVRPNVHRLKVANVNYNKSASDLRGEESARCINKGKENEEFAKEMIRREEEENKRGRDKQQGAIDEENRIRIEKEKIARREADKRQDDRELARLERKTMKELKIKEEDDANLRLEDEERNRSRNDAIEKKKGEARRVRDLLRK